MQFKSLYTQINTLLGHITANFLCYFGEIHNFERGTSEDTINAAVCRVEQSGNGQC